MYNFQSNIATSRYKSCYTISKNLPYIAAVHTAVSDFLNFNLTLC